MASTGIMLSTVPVQLLPAEEVFSTMKGFDSLWAGAAYEKAIPRRAPSTDDAFNRVKGFDGLWAAAAYEKMSVPKRNVADEIIAEAPVSLKRADATRQFSRVAVCPVDVKRTNASRLFSRVAVCPVNLKRAHARRRGPVMRVAEAQPALPLSVIDLNVNNAAGVVKKVAIKKRAGRSGKEN